jgi:transposase InsO family protein
MGMEGERAMSWKEVNTMILRKEFVALAQQAGSNVRELCRRYEISSRTGYKWLKRYKQAGEEGLLDRSKRPKHIPVVTGPEMETRVLAIRDDTGWGGRKIAQVLREQGHERVPHANTITDILRRAGRLEPVEQAKHQPSKRFERSQPNELWQMDFKGHFATLNGRCHPFTVLDDHSRFCLGLKACGDESGQTVKAHLQTIFRQYGLPKAILCDNGGPWGGGYPQLELSQLAVWWIRLGIHPQHGRPAHPQTQGKEERFHRTLKTELLQGRSFSDLTDCQRKFDPWRDRYNLLRPHEALQLDPPVRHFHLSARSFPEILPPVEYDSGTILRKVQSGGDITYHDLEYKVGKGLEGQYVRLHPTTTERVFEVYFCQYMVRTISVIR